MKNKYYNIKMRTMKVVFFLFTFCASSLINTTASIGYDSVTVRTRSDRNINVKDRNTWWEANTRLRSHSEHTKPKEIVEKRQIRHRHFHRDEQPFRRNMKQDEKLINSETSDSSKIYNARAALYHKYVEAHLKKDKHTTQKPIGLLESIYRREINRGNNHNNYQEEKHNTYDEDEKDDEYDEYDDEYDDEYNDDDDDFLADDVEDDDEKDEVDKSVHVDPEVKYSSAEGNQRLMSYRIPQTDTIPDRFNYDQTQDEVHEWVDSPQSDASDGTPQNLKWSSVPLGHNRRNRKIKKADRNAVVQHIQMVTNNGSCKIPRPRVIPIQNIHPNHAKQYTPHCTILHRCGEDTGCCLSDIATCSPKSIETVHLYFYTQQVGEEYQVEKLAFENHTECGCVEKRSEMMVKDEIAYLSMRPTYSYLRETTEISETESPPPIIKKCHCPSMYSVHMLDDGECECDCFSKQSDCMRIKRGKEYFGYKDRQCIKNGPCKTPNCEFGEYIDKAGRCPRRQEKTDDSTKSSKFFGKL